MIQRILMFISAVIVISIAGLFFKKDHVEPEPTLQPTLPKESNFDQKMKTFMNGQEEVTVNASFCIVVATYGDIVMLDCGGEGTHLTNDPDSIDE